MSSIPSDGAYNVEIVAWMRTGTSNKGRTSFRQARGRRSMYLPRRATPGTGTCAPRGSTASRRRAPTTACSGWPRRSSPTRASPRRRSSSGGRRSWAAEVAEPPEDEGDADFEGLLLAANAQGAEVERLADGFRRGFSRGRAYNLKDLLVEIVLSKWFRADAIEDADPVRLVALRDAGARRLLTPEELAAQDRGPHRPSVGCGILASAPRIRCRHPSDLTDRVSASVWWNRLRRNHGAGTRPHVGDGWCGEEGTRPMVSCPVVMRELLSPAGSGAAAVRRNRHDGDTGLGTRRRVRDRGELVRRERKRLSLRRFVERKVRKIGSIDVRQRLLGSKLGYRPERTTSTGSMMRNAAGRTIAQPGARGVLGRPSDCNRPRRMTTTRCALQRLAGWSRSTFTEAGRLHGSRSWRGRIRLATSFHGWTVLGRIGHPGRLQRRSHRHQEPSS